MAAAGPVKTGLSGVIKRGWNEIPDVVAGSGLALLGLVFTGIGLTRYYSMNMDNRKYKTGYVVMRPDDPRAALVHKD